MQTDRLHSPEVPMDLSLQTQSPSTRTNSQAGDLDSLSHSLTENAQSAYETGTEAMSDPSDSADKSTETLTNTSRCLSREKSTHSARLKLSSSSYNVSDCLPLCSEPVPMDSDLRVCANCGSTDPVRPLSPPSCDLMNPLSEMFTFYINQEPSLPFSLMQDTTIPETFGATSSTSEEQSQAISLMSTTLPSHSSESDTAIATVPELYIFENERQDSILDPNVDLHEIKCHYYETRVPVCDSADVLTKTHHSSTEGQAVVDYESDTAQRAGLKPHAADASEESLTSVNVNKLKKVEVSAVTPQARQNDSPVELWLDACQYLAGENTEIMDVLERRSLSVMQEELSVIRDSSFPPGETQESGYSPEGSEGIGWSCEDIRGPRVERWSSVDSWATALSDWTGIITEDITPAFTEIGVEVGALTQALAEVITDTDKETSKGRQIPSQPPMGILDKPQESLNIPESSILSGESSHPLCLPAVGPELQTSVGFQSSESLCVFNGYVDTLETDIFVSNKDPVILNIIEESDFEKDSAPIEIITGEPSAGGLCGVTNKHSPCSVAQQDPRSGCEPTKVDDSSADPHLFTTNTVTNSHVSDVDTQSGLHLKVDTNVLVVTLPDVDGTCQVEPQWGSPKFIMPLVPLSPSSSLICQTSSSLEGDHICVKTSLNDNRDPSCGHVQPCVLWPISDGITDIATTEGYKEQTHKKEKTMDLAEKCLPKGQLDLNTGNTSECFLTEGKTIAEEINNLSREFSSVAVVPADNFVISEKNRVAIITLDLNDPPLSRPEKPIAGVQSENPVRYQRKVKKMPHKSHKHASESKTRSKKDKSAGHHHGAQASQTQETLSHHATAQQTCRQPEIHFPVRENLTSVNASAEREESQNKLEIGANMAAKKVASKQHGKKKKKTGQNTAVLKNTGEPQADEENGAKPKTTTTKGRINMFEAKFDAKSERAKKDSGLADVAEKKSQQLQPKDSQEEPPAHHEEHKDHQPKNCSSPLKKDIIKRRQLSGDKFGKLVSVLESKLPKSDVCIKAKTDEPKADTETTHKKAYSEVVKQKILPKEDPKVVQPIQAVPVSMDPQSLCLCCQFASVSDYTVTWSREDTLLTEIKRSAGDESKVSLTISSASRKDLGKYQCRLSSLHGSVTLDYLLTYEVLNEIVILPSTKTITSASVTVGNEEEDVHCSRLMFKEDFLSDQYFGDNHPVSIVTEKVHFGEGMHRRAFRTKLQAGQIPCLVPGHSCVLKVHNVITCGTKNNDELVKKNFTLAVEECQVQNTAREYIKAYTAAAQSVDDFGEVPEIIPIYLVHRPSSDIPYATLEEELIGDFVKYSVKDGKEINLLRCDSEAGQKCCAFQHWVYHNTEGNLLVTDMQGVGMRLTDVGIATCRKGYKGFKGNCSTSFIDQFKALHQCNTYCKILGLTSLQPKAKKPMSAPKPKPQPLAAPKKKTFGPTVKGKP